MLSPSPLSYFDERADGFVPGEAVGAVVSSDSPTPGDRDHILRRHQGSASTRTGRPRHTRPSASPRSVSSARCTRRSVSTRRHRYGRGARDGHPLADPIEFDASVVPSVPTPTRRATAPRFGEDEHRARVRGGWRKRCHPCSPGARASPVAPRARLREGHPRIDLDSSPFFVKRNSSTGTSARRAQACGGQCVRIRGTNAHLAIEEAPEAVRSRAHRPGHIMRCQPGRRTR